MAEEDGEALHSVAEALRRADELGAEAESRLRTAQDLYRQIFERLPEGHDRGLVAQRVWDTGKRLRSAPLYFSQAGQDRFLDEHVFEGKRDGIFIEIGAYDGVTGSNCLFFEAFRGWTGIAVEPLAHYAKQAAAIRQSPCLEVAVGPEDGVANFLHVTNGFVQMSGLMGTYDPDIMEAVRDNPDHEEMIAQVTVRRLDGLLREHDIHRADYCSIDVEGAELAILSSFPFDAFEIAVWSIENNTRKSEIREVMEANGFECLTVLGVDEIYQRTNASR